MRGHPLDLDALHKVLWTKADHFGRMRLSQRDFAKEAGIAHETVCRAFSRMADQGRLTRLKSEKNNIGVYHVIDPELWTSQQDPFVPGEG